MNTENSENITRKRTRTKEKRQPVGLTLTESTKERLDRLCEITGMTRSSVIAMCINTYAFEKMGLAVK